MENATERRRKILELLSLKRKVKLANLMEEFHVSRSTIKRDIEILSCSAPIFTVQGNGGGVYVSKGWYINRVYLTQCQEALLLELIVDLEIDKRAVMQSILDTFAAPKR